MREEKKLLSKKDEVKKQKGEDKTGTPEEQVCSEDRETAPRNDITRHLNSNQASASAANSSVASAIKGGKEKEKSRRIPKTGVAAAAVSLSRDLFTVAHSTK